MNLIFDAERLKYANFGLYHFSMNLGRAIAAAKEKHNVKFFVPPAYDGFFGNHVHYKKVCLLDKLNIFGHRKSDVWHITNQLSRYIPGKGIKKVLTIHDLNFLYERPSARRIKKYLDLVQKKVDNVDHIVCISNFTKRDVEAHLNTRGKQISVIYNGLNQLDPSMAAQPPHIPKRPFFFTLGGMVSKKNFHVLPALVKKSGFDLVIAGDDSQSYVQNIQAEVNRWGVQDHVTIVGPITEAEKIWYYKNCRALLFPSLAEGFGFPVIEAMQFGKPVFLSTLTALPEIGGNCAYYFQSFDPEHMRSVLFSGLDDFDARKRELEMKNWASQFQWCSAAEAYWRVYESLG
jgi:glycosyltransferase involved in cell wall biosynthesis